MARLRSVRQDLIYSEIDAHGGRIVPIMGDSFLDEFASTIAAVRCAVAIQRAPVAVAGLLDRRLQFRIGPMSATSSPTATTSSATASISPRAWKASPGLGHLPLGRCL